MSTVDDRIVRMQFDNAQFEAGVMRSMKTLDELNEKLQFKEASKGLSALMVTIEGVSSKSVSAAVGALDKISSYTTSVLGMVAQKIKTQFADKIVNAIEAIPTRAMNQIKSGGWNRAMNIANAKFQIEGLQYSWDKVREAADYAVTDTAYGLDAAAKAASQLAASGVDFEKVIGKDGAGTDVTQMHKALRAISGVAAMTNASYDDIAHTFTRIAGQGRVMANDLNSLASRGLNAAATLAKALNVTEAEVRDMVSKGAIDFELFSEAMDEAYGDHAKEANKTFTGSLSNMKAALSRIGAIFTQPVIDKTNTFFVAVTDRIKEFQKALNDTTNADGTKTLRFAGHFAEAWESGVDAASKFVKFLDLSWFQSIGRGLDNLAVKAKTVFDGVNTWFDKAKNSADKLETIGEKAKMTIEDLALVEAVIRGDYGNGLIRINEFAKKGLDYERIQGFVNIAETVDYDLKQLGWTIEDLNKETEEAVENGNEAELRAERLSKTIGNFFNSLKYGRDAVVNFGGAVKTILATAINNLTASMAGPLVMSRRIAEFTHSLSAFTKELQPTESMLRSVAVAVNEVGTDFTNLTDKIATTATAIVKFAAECLRSEKTLEEIADDEKLTPLRKSVVSVMLTIKNLGIVVANVASSIYKIVRAIVKGIGRAFNPSGVLAGVSDFSTGLRELSERFKVTDEFAESLSNVFETLATVVFKVASGIAKAVGSIVRFITSIGNAKKPTEAVKDTLSGVEETGEKADSIFDKLKTTLEKFKKKIEELPQKFEEFKDAVNQQEGVIRLKESLEKLKTSIKENLEKLKPFKQGIEEVAEEAGGEGETTIGKLANGIGVVAGKLADFIDKLPTWGQKIEEFWNNVKTTVEGWVSTIHLDKFFDNLGKGVSDFFTSDDSIIGKVKTFASNIFDSIVMALEDVDWKKVGKGSMIALIAANLFSFFKISSGIATTIKGVASIPKSIAKIFTQLGDVFTTASRSMKAFTKAYVFSAIVSSLMLIVSAVMVLGTMDEGELKQGISALVWIGIFMMMLGKLVNSILGTGGEYFNKQNIKKVDKSSKNLLQINNKLGGLIGAGILLAGLGAAVWLSMQGIISVSKEMKKNADGVKAAVGALLRVMLIIGVAFAGVAVATKFLSNQTKDGKVIIDNLFGAGILLAGIGVAVFVVAKAFVYLAKDLKGVDGSDITYAALTIVAIMAMLGAFVYLAGKGLQGVDWKAMGTMAIVMMLAIGSIGVIVGEILLLGLVLNKFNNLFPAESVLGAMAVVVTVMLAMGLMVYLMAKGLADVDKPGALIGLVLMMGLFVGAVAASIIVMAKALSDPLINSKKIGLGIAGLLLVIAAVGAAIFAIAALTNNKFQGADRVRDTLLSIGAVFLLVGLMAFLIAEATARMSDAKPAAIGVMVGFVAAVLLAMVYMSKLAANSRGNGDEIATMLFGVSLAFVAIAAATLIFAAAIKLLSTINFDGMLAPLIGITVALVAFIAIAAVLAHFNLGEKFKDVAIGMALIGATFLLAGAGIWLAAKGIELLVSVSSGLVTTIRSVAEALAEHPAIFAGVLLGITALVVLVYLITKNIGPIVNVICSAVGTVVNFISVMIEKLGKNLKTGGKNLSTWWSNLQPKIKIGIVSGIATLCAAILKASPEMLKTAKELIKKLIFFLVDIIPTVVDGLVEILLRVINGLADSIRKNSAKIAYAFWNVLEALAEVIFDVLVEGAMLFIRPINAVIEKFGGHAIELDVLKDAANASKAALRGNLSAMKDYAETSEESITRLTGLDASMNKVTEDLEKEAIHYDNTTAGLEKYRGELNAASKAQDKTADSRGGLISSLKDKFNLGDSFNFDGFSTDQLQGMLNGNSLSIPGSNIGIDTPSSDVPDMTTFMEGQGYNEEDISIEAYDNGETYTDSWASGMTSDDSQQQIQNATNDNVDIVTDTIAKRDRDLQDATRIGIITPYNRTIVGNASTSYNNGYYIVQRAIDGGKKAYEDNKNQIKKTAAEGADLIWRGANSKDGIDANSPSKKFYKSGLWCILGIQQAIKDNSYLATGQMEDLGGSMVESIGESMDYVGKIASGEIEYDPRIRPVLDVTSVGRGASDISSMFANQNVSLAGLSGQIAYDMTNLNGSNAAVVAELQALREDMNLMTDELTNMQIVMDTGALVGSTVGAYDEAFGKMAAYGERGN